MFDFISMLTGGILLMLAAAAVAVAVVTVIVLHVLVMKESGWVSCLCVSMGYVGIAFLTLGVPFWGPSIPQTTTGVILGILGWTSAMFVFGAISLFHHEIGEWFKAREFKKAVKNKTLEVVYEGDRITFRSSKKARRNHPSYK